MFKRLAQWLSKFRKGKGVDMAIVAPTRIQFILKYRETQYTNEDGYNTCGTLESGLYNSAKFMVEMLNAQPQYYEAEIIQVPDNNGIDKEVTRFKPNIVIIEAFWVVPEKFDVLTKLHPNVKWVVRNHSKAPFLANEGIGFDWAIRYSDYPNVYVASNAKITNDEIAHLIKAHHPEWSMAQAKERCPFLPNYYPIERLRSTDPCGSGSSSEIHIGCFGAIRPLKNHIIQALAAIKYADKVGKKLYFHINATRLENQGSNQILKNLKMIFQNIPHDLVEHEWMPHAQFLDLIGSMDFGLQVSYSETFNIVSADMISQGVPVIVSDEIDWMEGSFVADPNNSDDIVQKLVVANIYAKAAGWVIKNQENLIRYNEHTQRAWASAIKALVD